MFVTTWLHENIFVEGVQYEKTTSTKRQTTYFSCVSSHLLSHLIQLELHTHNLLILLHRNGCILRCLQRKDLKLKKEGVENIIKQWQYLERKGHKPSLVFMRVLCPSQIGRWSVGFLLGEENQRTQKKTLRVGEEPTTNSTHFCYRAGIEPRPHWWDRGQRSIPYPRQAESAIHFRNAVRNIKQWMMFIGLCIFMRECILT